MGCLQVGGGSRGPPCRPARLVFSATRPAATAILVGGFSFPDWTLWLPGAP
jgi:hypothetical protein